MDMTQMNATILQMLSATTCEEIDNFLKSLNTSEYELQNITREEYINSLRSPHCVPKPYPILRGLQKWIVTIILVLFLVFGLIGNSISATIMFRRSRRGLSSYFYLALLAIFDICILYTGCLLVMLDITFDIHPQLYSKLFCRLAFYIQHLFTYISAWLIVAVTFERLMVVRFPFQSIRICRMRVAYTVTIIILIFFSLYTAHVFFTMNLFNVNTQTDEGYHPNHTVCDLLPYRPILAILDLSFYSVIPSILILIFNILIIITMFHAIKKRRSYLQANSYVPTINTSQRNKNKTSSTIRTQFLRSRSAESNPAGRPFNQINKQRIYNNQTNMKYSDQLARQKPSCDSTSATGIRLTCLLLIISFIFVICTLPISIRSLLSGYLSSLKSTKPWQITQLCLTLLMFLNHTVNFVLYCLTGRTFRSECRKLLCSLWIFKDIHISCTTNLHSDKHEHYHHQQLILMDRHRYTHPQHQQQRINPIIKGAYV